MPENEIFKEESQLSEYTSILLVACVQVKLSAVEVRLFFGENNTELYQKKSFSQRFNGHRLPNST